MRVNSLLLLVAGTSLVQAYPVRRALTRPETKLAAGKRENRVQSLLQWAEEVQIACSKTLQLTAEASSGLGWFSKGSKLPNNQVLIQVPTDQALSIESPGDGPNDRRVLEAVPDTKAFRELPWFVQMSVYLNRLKELGDKKVWLESLPTQLDTPIHWTSGMDDLQYPYLQDSVARQSQRWKGYYDKLGISSLSYDDFVWGCEMARSRAFSGAYTGSAFNPLIYAFTLFLVTIYVGLNLGTLEQAANGAGVVVSVSILKDFVVPKLFKTKRYVICPMIDMTNHRSKPSAEVSFEYFANAYSLATTEDIPAGEQVFISYGARSNDQLLQYYGFVEPDNPCDVYVMPPLREWDIGALEKATGRTFEAGRLEKLNRAGLLGSDVVDDDGDIANTGGGVVLTRVSGIDPAILQALRALVSTKEEWEGAGEAVGNFVTENSAGVENETAARTAARTAIEMELASKTTTLEQDLALLKKTGSMKSQSSEVEDKLALLFRIEKKKLLTETINRLR